MDKKKEKVVMVGMDDSECSDYALRWALQNLGPTLSRSHLLLFAAQPLLEFTVDLINDLQENQRKATLSLLASAKEVCAKHGNDVINITQNNPSSNSYMQLIRSNRYWVNCSHRLCEWIRECLESVDNEEFRGLDDSVIMLNYMIVILCSESLGELMLVILGAQVTCSLRRLNFVEFSVHTASHAKMPLGDRCVSVSLISNDMLDQDRIIAEMATEVGEPREAICEAAEKLDAQLLIMGSHRRGAIKRAFLGSVSDYCVHNARCPVLVVKKPA